MLLVLFPSPRLRRRCIYVKMLYVTSSNKLYVFTSFSCSQAFGVYVLLTELPNYMKNILGLDLKTKAFLAGLPYLVMWLVSGLGSILVDLVIERRVMSRTGARKVANTLAMLVPSFALIGICLNNRKF